MERAGIPDDTDLARVQTELGALTDPLDQAHYLGARAALWPLGAALVDEELRYVWVNPALAQLNGRPVEEHIGRRIVEVIDTDLAARLEVLLRGVLASGQAMRGLEASFSADREGPPPQAGTITLRASFLPVPATAPSRVLAIIEDVSP